MKRPRTDYIVVHCADTYARMDIGLKEITHWHTDAPPKGNGWSTVGYHFIIRRDGTREIGVPVDSAGIHVKGFNTCSVGVCLVGGKGDNGEAENNFTKAQFDALWEILEILRMHYPNAEVVGHRDLNPDKPCPSFDAKSWYAAKLQEHDA